VYSILVADQPELRPQEGKFRDAAVLDSLEDLGIGFLMVR